MGQLDWWTIAGRTPGGRIQYDWLNSSWCPCTNGFPTFPYCSCSRGGTLIARLETAPLILATFFWLDLKARLRWLDGNHCPLLAIQSPQPALHIIVWNFWKWFRMEAAICFLWCWACSVTCPASEEKDAFSSSTGEASTATKKPSKRVSMWLWMEDGSVADYLMFSLLLLGPEVISGTLMTSGNAQQQHRTQMSNFRFWRLWPMVPLCF